MFRSVNIAGATIGLACGVGLYTPISSMFFRALEIEFHWSRTAIVIALIALPITALFLPVVGRLVDRFGVRPVAGTSAVLMAMTFFAAPPNCAPTGSSLPTGKRETTQMPRTCHGGCEINVAL